MSCQDCDLNVAAALRERDRAIEAEAEVAAMRAQLVLHEQGYEDEHRRATLLQEHTTFLKTQLADALRDVERLRMKGGRAQAANATWMQLCAWLARNGQQETAQKWKRRADAAAADVRLEDFVVAGVGRGGRL